MGRWGLFALCAATIAAPAWGQEFDRPYWLDRPVIEAIGYAQVVVPADEASFSVTFMEVDADSRNAMFAASDKARLAAAAIRSRGGNSVHITSSADIEAIHSEYRNRDGERIASERADQIENYAVSVTLNVRVTDVNRAADVRAAAMAVGPQEASDLSYGLSVTAPARLRAFREAAEDAAARARAAAQASGAGLGPLLVLQEGQGPCLGRWQTGPSRRDQPQYAPSPVTQYGSDEEESIVVTGSRVRALRLTAEDIQRMQLPSDMAPMQLTAQVCAIYGAG